MKSVQERILDAENELDLLGNKVPCTKEETEACERTLNSDGQLPNGIFCREVTSQEGADPYYYRIENYSKDEENRKYLLSLQKAKYLRTIKNCVVFFTVTAIIGIVAYVIALLTHM